jgi:hypothetical protein
MPKTLRDYMYFAPIYKFFCVSLATEESMGAAGGGWDSLGVSQKLHLIGWA